MWLYRAIFSLACRTQEEYHAAQALYQASKNDTFTLQRILKWQQQYAYLSRTPLFSSVLARLKSLHTKQSNAPFLLDEIMSQDLQKLNSGKPVNLKTGELTFNGLAYHLKTQAELAWAPVLIERIAHFSAIYPTFCYPIRVAAIHPLHGVPDDVLLRLYNLYALEDGALHFTAYVDSYVRSCQNFTQEGEVLPALAEKMAGSLHAWSSNPHADDEDLIDWLKQHYHFHALHTPHLLHFMHAERNTVKKGVKVA